MEQLLIGIVLGLVVGVLLGALASKLGNVVDYTTEVSGKQVVKNSPNANVTSGKLDGEDKKKRLRGLFRRK